jgi:hypothetical protein
MGVGIGMLAGVDVSDEYNIFTHLSSSPNACMLDEQYLIV